MRKHTEGVGITGQEIERETEMTHGFLAAGNMNIECLGQCVDMGHCKQYNNLLSKFPKDQMFLDEDERVTFLDGYIYNKDSIIQNNDRDWQHAFAHAVKEDAQKCLQTLRGGFCGYQYDKKENSLIAFTDQVSVKALYYYADGTRWMISNHLAYMVEVLKANGIPYSFHELAAQYMLTYGYMLDDSTFIREIHRLLPGQYVHILDGQISVKRYYIIPNEEIQMTEQEAVEKVDAAFREAIRREFEKDKEYGYQHLVDLSGGLDSRMVSWVAHDMGYTDQLNVTYSKSDYYDDKISKEIADYLNHEYLFKSLDDAKWLYDIDEIVEHNNGAALYTGITGGRRLLRTLNTDKFGIEHTGMIGDAILSTFYHDRAFNYGKPQLGLHKYSETLSYEFDDAVTKDYPCQEMFAINTRGILGAQSSYIIRQHYVETASPFMDVDFLESAFSLPFEYRNRHHIYLKWMLEKYPEATKFGWEKWGGIRPMESHIFFRKVKTVQRLLWQVVCKAVKIESNDNMNPIEYWYQKDRAIQKYYQSYYDDNIKHTVLNEDLKRDISFMFQQGSVAEKGMALTVLAIIKKYFN